jgi:DNA polymerase-4
VKLKFHDFTSTTCERACAGFPNEKDFVPLLEEAFARKGEPVRLIGLGARIEAPRSGARSAPGQLKFEF